MTNLNEMLAAKVGDWMARIVCKSGLSLSVQASNRHYCHPRENVGPYKTVEVGFPSKEIDDLMEYAEDPSRPTDTVYGYVPIQLVEKVIDDNGGVEVEGK